MRLLRDERGDMAEAAVTLPVVILVILALFTLSMAGMAATTAANAANYGARMGSTAQADAGNLAVAAARDAVGHADIGTYRVDLLAPGGTPGSTMAVRVRWQIPNFFAGIIRFFGRSSPDTLSGESISYFRQEGW